MLKTVNHLRSDLAWLAAQVQDTAADLNAADLADEERQRRHQRWGHHYKWRAKLDVLAAELAAAHEREQTPEDEVAEVEDRIAHVAALVADPAEADAA